MPFKLTATVRSALVAALAFGSIVSAQAVTVNIQQKSIYSSGYSADVIITNDAGAATLSSWKVSFKLGNSNKVTKVWGSTVTGADPYTFTNLSYNGSIAAGKTEQFGFNATGTISSSTAGACSINGKTCTLQINGKAVGGASSTSSAPPPSSKSSSSASSAKPVSSSSSAKPVSSSSSAKPVSSSSSSAVASKLIYRQNFDAKTTGILWEKSLDGTKLKAHPENALVTAKCGVGSSNCLRVVYRHPDGIHKAPASNPAFTTSGGTVNWQVDTTKTNTATDVVQWNMPISGVLDTSTKTDTPVPVKAATLTYNLYFEPGFDFAKGGKLPGLASAQFDSGCTEDGNVKRSNTNWSVRVMWRPNGRLELYSYDQSRPSGNCGITRVIDRLDSEPLYEVPGKFDSGDGKFRLKAGVWYTVRVSIKMNDNNKNTYQKDASGAVVKDSFGDPIVTGGNGEVSLSIKTADGSVKRNIIYPNVALRDECNGACGSSVKDSGASQINGMFFSTFFGGNETKRLTCINSAKSTETKLVQNALPSYSGLTQTRFNELCAGQMTNITYGVYTWNPMKASAAAFDNIEVNNAYTNKPF